MTAPPPMHPLADGIAGFLFRHRHCLLGVVAVLCFLDVAAAALTYLVYPGYLDHGEPVVAMASWRLLGGFPVYPPLGGPDLTSNIYGPISYLAHAVAYLLAGPGVAAGKAAGVAAAVAVPVIVFMAQRRNGLAWASVAVVLAAGYIVLGLPTSVWNRPDPFLALLVAVAVWAMNASDDDRPEWGKCVLIGICGGLAAGLKLHGGVYFVPVVVLFCWPRGLRALLVIAATGAAALALPFAFEPFSLTNFAAWFPLVMAKKSAFLLATKVFRYLAFYLAPVLLFVAALRWADPPLTKAEIAYAAAFLAAVPIALFPALKPGAGWYYFFPFLAVCVDMTVRYGSRVAGNGLLVRGGVGVLAGALLVVSVPVQKRFARALHWDEAARITADVRGLMDAFPGVGIQMGAGDSIVGYNKTLYKPLLVFAGHPYTLDVGIAIETSASGIPLPKETRTRIEDCHTEIWLVPAGESPFALIGYYGNPVFDDSFRAAFALSYEKRRSGEYFDAWGCRR